MNELNRIEAAMERLRAEAPERQNDILAVIDSMLDQGGIAVPPQDSQARNVLEDTLRRSEADRAAGLSLSREELKARSSERLNRLHDTL